VQQEFLETIPGLENVRVQRFGYAVEYDFVEPTQLSASLQTKGIEGLFLAGQINGTSGYEEAAAQGWVAGVNASKFCKEESFFIMRRDESYIGVMVDDLVTKGTREPYRMFTSRAEHRLILREDNTLDRLMGRGFELGLVSSQNFEKFSRLSSQRQELLSFLRSTKVYPNQLTQEKLRNLGTSVLTKPLTLEELLRRPEICVKDLTEFGMAGVAEEVGEPLEIDVKYSGYVKRQLEIVEQTKKLDEMRLDADLEYSSIMGLSNEEVEKLTQIRPLSLGQAGRISGVNPSAIQALLIHLKGKGQKLREMRVYEQ
jgi:tRNA uridine 5-carboxymethylaminomethyl modification enzyme